MTNPSTIGLTPANPRISILMPVYNTPPDVLAEAIQSVLDQSYQDWELCICDDASTSTATISVLKQFRGSDPRLKITRSAENLHIARATNLAAEFATGHFVGFLDHDDLLTPDALELMAQAVVSNPEADVLYSDEDKLEEDGSVSEPYLKPDWSPEHLGSVAYLLHFMMIRKSMFLAIGGLRHEFTGAQDYDLSLRATALARKVVHVPHVLYHWRKIAGSAAAVVDAKPQALINAHRAVESFACTQQQGARVSPGLFTGSFRIDWPVDPERPVTLLMMTDSRNREVAGRGNILLVQNAVRSIYKNSTFRNFELIIYDNGRMPEEVRAELTGLGARIELHEPKLPFSFPEKINAAFKFVQTEDVILLNDDIEVISPGWIEALLSHSRREGVGAVGARLLYPNDRTQHAGIVLGVHGASTHIFHNQPSDEIGYCGYTHVVRNYSAVTGAVLATRRSLFNLLSGFDERLRIDFNDTDFCLRLGSLGYRIVYTPHATLYHFEGATLTRTATNEEDMLNFTARWGSLISCDPYYNPRLPRDRTDCGVTSW
jgi:O-antigen biosynthesis protein